METALRKPRTPLIEDLLNNPYEFEFHQAIKIFEASAPHLPPLGDANELDQQPIIIKSRSLLSYPSSDIFSITQSLDTYTPPEMYVNFFGIAGSEGPLPMPYTEKLISRTAQKDYVMRDFLDIFNHRLLSILHKIKKKYNIALNATAPKDTPHARILSHLLGLSKPALKNRFAVPDDRFYGLSSFIWQQHRSAEGLRLFVEKFFQVPAVIDQFKGGWAPIDPNETTRLGRKGVGQNQVLGSTATLGTRFWDQQNTLEIKLGPLSYETFTNLLKSSERYKLFTEVARFYLQLTHQYNINLILRKEDVPALRLGHGQLAWSSWLKTQPFMDDDHQVVLSVET